MLLAGWASDLRFTWYTATPADRALERFVDGLSRALNERVPGFADELAAPIRSPRGANAVDAMRAAALAERLCSVLELRLGHELALVVDDLQMLGRAAGPARLLAELVRQAPPKLHLVLASRSELPFSVDRLRSRGDLLELEAEALAFGPGEIETLLGAALGGEATASARDVHEATGGWPAAVRLAVEALHPLPAHARATALEEMSKPRGSLYDYLASEAFSRERGAAEVLGKLATFDRFSVPLCRALGIRSAGTVLEGLQRRGLFVEQRSADGEWLALHSLLRGFARSAWPLEDSEQSELHAKAALWFAERDLFDDAVRSLGVAGDEAAARELLETQGEQMLARGAVESVIAAGAIVDQLGGRLAGIVGQAHQIRGDWRRARELLEAAAGSADTVAPGLAWRLGAIHFLQGDPEEALRSLSRARFEGTDVHDEALVLAWSASANWVQGRSDECRELGTRAREQALAVRDDQALAAADIALGVLAGMEGNRIAYGHFREGLEAAERAGDVLQTMRIRVNLQMPLFEDGRYEEALEELELAVEQAELSGYDFFRALGLNNQAETNLALGRLDEALAQCESAIAVYGRLGSRWLCLPLGIRGRIYAERGDRAAARASYDEACRLAKAAHEIQSLTSASVGLALLLVGEEPDRAVELADQALAHGHWWDHARLLVSAGWVALASGDRSRALELAREADGVAAARRNPAHRAAALELMALADDAGDTRRLLREALEIWNELGNPIRAARVELALARLSSPDRGAAERAERRLRSLGVRRDAELVAGLLAAVPALEPEQVEIRTLGGFRVLREGQPVPTADWRSRKARDLLKFLLARGGRRIPRELLMETLWPGEDPAKLGNRLSVALSIARAVLDPERKFDAEHFLRADKEAVELDVSHVAVDAQRFLRLADAGLAARRDGAPEAADLLIDAESLYAGDFLEEDVYEDWTVSFREQLRAAYVNVARALAEDARAGSAYDTAHRYYLRVLEQDPLDERAHLDLASTLGDAGRPAEARRRYRTYVERMTERGLQAAPFPAARGQPL
jgi:ATP/maltotriose-dependent transcriptional regulator MalT/DNA-binding SARP family transcriptional activator